MTHAIELTDTHFEQEVLKSAIPVLVDFWAVWCGPCKAIAPLVEAIAEEKAGKLKAVKIDVDKNQKVANQYGIRSIPTLLLFKNGRVVEQIVGALSKPMLLKKIEPHLE